MLLARLGIDENVTYAERYTRYNGEPLDNDTKNGPVKGAGVGGHWKLGLELEKEGDDYRWTTWTVEDGKHVVNFRCTISPNGKIKAGGRVNCFALGWMELEQDYVDILLAEFRVNPPVWDEITR